MNISYKIGSLIEYIHSLLILYILVGHVVTPNKYLHYYLYLIIFIFLDWNDYDGKCILTKYEYYFKYKKFNKDYEFFRPRVNKLFNLNLNKQEGDKLNNFLFMICFFIGFTRLLIFNRIIYY